MANSRLTPLFLPTERARPASPLRRARRPLAAHQPALPLPPAASPYAVATRADLRSSP